MKGRMRPYLPELTIRDYNTYQWYQRGVRRQLYTTYGLYSCYGLRYNASCSQCWPTVWQDVRPPVSGCGSRVRWSGGR